MIFEIAVSVHCGVKLSSFIRINLPGETRDLFVVPALVLPDNGDSRRTVVESFIAGSITHFILYPSGI